MLFERLDWSKAFERNDIDSRNSPAALPFQSIQSFGFPSTRLPRQSRSYSFTAAAKASDVDGCCVRPGTLASLGSTLVSLRRPSALLYADSLCVYAEMRSSPDCSRSPRLSAHELEVVHYPAHGSQIRVDGS